MNRVKVPGEQTPQPFADEQRIGCPKTPWMAEDEIACFQRWIPKRGQALEFGTGGSTRFFLENGIGRLWSIESDPAWHAALSEDPLIAFFIKKGRLFLHWADIGPVIPHHHGVPASSPHPSYGCAIIRAYGTRYARSPSASF